MIRRLSPAWSWLAPRCLRGSGDARCRRSATHAVHLTVHKGSGVYAATFLGCAAHASEFEQEHGG